MTEALAPSQGLAMARRDLAAARVLEDRLPELAAAAGFFAQQCAERALKAVLMWRDADLPRTHDLEQLLSLIRTAGVAVPAELFRLAEITPFAVELRYADPEAVSAESARTAIRLASSALRWAHAMIVG